MLVAVLPGTPSPWGARPSALHGRWLSDPPLTVLPGTRTIVLQEALLYVDRCGRTHYVPKGFASDGNSHPAWMYSFVGDRLTPEYRRAAILHDWYCENEELPARTAHALYLEALVDSGTQPARALVFWAGATWKNPRWK